MFNFSTSVLLEMKSDDGTDYGIISIQHLKTHTQLTSRLCDFDMDLIP